MIKKNRFIFLVLATDFYLISSYANCIDLNKASIRELKEILPKVGNKKARAIITYRTYHDGFKSLYEIEAVPGLGAHYLEQYLKLILNSFCYIL
jgi:competence ComEA-like helix-hairpin-helix protein